ncbi:glutathione S-transferase N-terminal domain-containing protein [Opacimonas viscosa]|uniref:Glutathione S-transferase N-terminal domain-containing protein n=1 Tax=Opacimonas viscosa TaxID=2961944 RepID=A0AA41WX91_9ALTE|nr:glutathione S-transferase N-terminal domain-containing protein [Opacimonas viscosa]MCP3428224.1 glutathione S-transferase N-terminal domain-containing protein [Opacimonas viscosa]
MITLHHLNNSRSQRILWLLEELGLEYTTQAHHRDAKTGLAPQSMRDIFPLGRFPVVTISTQNNADESHDNTPIVLSESGAIVEYLAHKYSAQATHLEQSLIIPPSAPLFQQYSFWYHFAEGTMMPPLIANLVLGKAKAKKKPIFVSTIANKVIDAILDAYYTPNHEANLEFVKSHLAQQQANGSPFFVGKALSAVDIMMLFPLEALVATQGKKIDAVIHKYVSAMQSRKAYLAALAKGGDYDFGPK